LREWRLNSGIEISIFVSIKSMAGGVGTEVEPGSEKNAIGPPDVVHLDSSHSLDFWMLDNRFSITLEDKECF